MPTMTLDDLKLTVVGLRAAAAMSRMHGHAKQADEFAALADKFDKLVVELGVGG